MKDQQGRAVRPDRGNKLAVAALSVAILTASISASNCGSVAPSTSPPPPPPPPPVTVVVTPASAALFLGQSQSFHATVTGTTNSALTWKVNGVAGGNTTIGTIAATGLYSAPQVLPSPASVNITATSAADPTASGSATVSLQSDVNVSVSPSAVSIVTGATQIFTAKLTASGSPSLALAWSVNGILGGNTSVGTVVATGAGTASYTGPVSLPSPPTVTVSATSVADPSKSGSAAVTIQCGAADAISPQTASVGLGQTQVFDATICAPAGAAINWDVNGITGGNPLIGMVTNSGGNSTTYTAPSILPSPDPVTVRATSQTNPPHSVSASVTVVSMVIVSVTPQTANVSVGQRASFSATVLNSSDPAVNWAVNGTANGNASVGQICVPKSNPCAAPAGAIPGSAEYLAPAAVPAQNPVTLTATSQADPSRHASAAVTVLPPAPVRVSVSPPYAFVAAAGQTGSTQQFIASVAGTTNTGVTWAVAGPGCSGSGCGTIDGNGLFAAPSAAPSPNSITITATSQADPAQSATAAAAITSGPVIESLAPSSVEAGAASGFTLALAGLNFAPGSGSGASVILFDGAVRATTCPSAARCTTALAPGDVSAAATHSVQIQNPGSSGALSNPVPFVVAPFTATADVISLTSTQPDAAGRDITVVEPTTAADAAAMNVDFIGFVTGGNTCSAQGSPVIVARPSSGTATFNLCVHGNRLDPSFTYEFSGPAANDISVTATSLAGLFPNLIQLSVVISSATLPGPRALFITTANHDQAAASGMLEVK